MSNVLLDFRNHNKDHPDVKYSEMAETDDKYRNGSIDEQSQIDYERNDSVCPLTSEISRRGKMEYRSDDHLDFRVSKYKATKYKKFAIIFAGVAIMLAVAVVVLAVVLASKGTPSTTTPTKPTKTDGESKFILYGSSGSQHFVTRPLCRIAAMLETKYGLFA